jgi:hypothetical protein
VRKKKNFKKRIGRGRGRVRRRENFLKKLGKGEEE